MESRNIYLYWVGKEYKLISILRNLIYLHSTSGKEYKVNLLTEHNIKDYIKDIPAYFNKLLPAHQADFVRVHVICEYGGIWLDSDTLVLDSLDTLFDLIEINDGFFIKENNSILWNGIFGSKPNTPLMNKWKIDMMYKLDNTQGKIEWSDIGGGMLQNIYITNESLYDKYKIFNGLDNLYPVDLNNCVKEFLDKPYDNYKSIIREYQPLVVLVNSVYKRLESMTEQEILAGRMPLNYFINKSLEKKGISKNLMYTNQLIYNYGIRDYISKSIIDHKCWEPNISGIFDRILKNNKNKESVVIDIGCNLGYYSILSANNTGISKIYGIDANIDNIYMLKMSSAINNIKHIESLQFCISEKSGYFFKPSNKEFAKKGGNIGGMAYAKTTDNVNNDTSISTTIDEVVKMKSITDIIIMKIDIEGGELNALKGASDTLKKNIIKHIIIEITPKFNNDSIEILQILKNNNYNLYNIPHVETGQYNNMDILSNICKNPIKDIEQFVKGVAIQTNILAINN